MKLGHFPGTTTPLAPAVARAGVLAAVVAAIVAIPGTPAGGGPTAPAARVAAPDAGTFASHDPDAEDRDDRLVMFDERGALSEPQAEALRLVVRRQRDVTPSIGIEAFACLPEPRDRARAMTDSIAREFAAAGIPAWSLRVQPAGCTLPGAVLLRMGS